MRDKIFNFKRKPLLKRLREYENIESQIGPGSHTTGSERDRDLLNLNFIHSSCGMSYIWAGGWCHDHAITEKGREYLRCSDMLVGLVVWDKEGTQVVHEVSWGVGDSPTMTQEEFARTKLAPAMRALEKKAGKSLFPEMGAKMCNCENYDPSTLKSIKNYEKAVDAAARKPEKSRC